MVLDMGHAYVGLVNPVNAGDLWHGRHAAFLGSDHAAKRARSSACVSATFRPGGIQNIGSGLRPFIQTIQQ